MKQKQTLFIIVLMLILTFSSKSNAAYYNVKAGDQRDYIFTKYLYQGKQEYNTQEFFENGTSYNYTLKIGVRFSIKVCNTSSDTTRSPFIQRIVNGNAFACFSSPIGYITSIKERSSYENTTSSDSKLKNVIHGDILTQTSNYTYGNNIWVLNSWNITTGWIYEHEVIETNLTGELISDIAYSLATNSVSSAGFEFTPVISLFLIVTPIVILKKKKYQ